jgi:hypothetical protein
MDVESTVQFLLESHAKLVAHVEAVDQRVERLGDLFERGIKLFLEFRTESERRTNALVDAQLAADAAIVRLAGSQEQLAESHKQLAESHKQLAEAQRVTELKLQAFIDSLNKGRNGHA